MGSSRHGNAKGIVLAAALLLSAFLPVSARAQGSFEGATRLVQALREARTPPALRAMLQGIASQQVYGTANIEPELVALLGDREIVETLEAWRTGDLDPEVRAVLAKLDDRMLNVLAETELTKSALDRMAANDCRTVTSRLGDLTEKLGEAGTVGAPSDASRVVLVLMSRGDDPLKALEKAGFVAGTPVRKRESVVPWKGPLLTPYRHPASGFVALVDHSGAFYGPWLREGTWVARGNNADDLAALEIDEIGFDRQGPFLKGRVGSPYIQATTDRYGIVNTVLRPSGDPPDGKWTTTIQGWVIDAYFAQSGDLARLNIQLGAEGSPRYQIVENADGKGSRAGLCPQCGRRSFHPEDIRHRYCPQCEVFWGNGERSLVSEGIEFVGRSMKVDEAVFLAHTWMHR